MALENFFTEDVCLDLSHKPLCSDISIADLEAAEDASGVRIQPRDTVLLHMDFYRRTYGTDAYLSDFPGLTKESATWLGAKGITMFGVEAVSPGRPGRNNFEVHHVCRNMHFTHIEGLVNLDQLIGQGRFRFISFPLRIRGAPEVRSVPSRGWIETTQEQALARFSQRIARRLARAPDNMVRRGATQQAN